MRRTVVNNSVQENPGLGKNQKLKKLREDLKVVYMEKQKRSSIY